MSNSEFGSLSLFLLVILGTAHVFGYLATRLRQPRVIGEIFAGVLLGPALFGRFAGNIAAEGFLNPFSSSVGHNEMILGLLYDAGLSLLMFASGAETKGLFKADDRREVGWLAVIGTGIPFLVGLLAFPMILSGALMGVAKQRTPLLLVVGMSIAVTSIPVISRIFYDLKILHTRFARIILGVAVLEDIVLWSVLAIATSLARAGNLPRTSIVVHVANTLIYFGVSLVLMPRVLKAFSEAEWNPLPRVSPVAYTVLILLAYSVLATAFDVSLVFAAFLAGYAIASQMTELERALAVISKVAFGVFIPIYFVIVGYRLDLTKSFSFTMLVTFMLFACIVKLLSTGIGARLAGFGWHDSLNLAMALNAKGGPGIVLASVAFDAHIINAAFYTTLVLVAIFTSQMAGTWLEFVLRKGWPLLSGYSSNSEAETAKAEELAR